MKNAEVVIIVTYTIFMVLLFVAHKAYELGYNNGYKKGKLDK